MSLKLLNQANRYGVGGSVWIVCVVWRMTSMVCTITVVGIFFKIVLLALVSTSAAARLVGVCEWMGVVGLFVRVGTRVSSFVV